MHKLITIALATAALSLFGCGSHTDDGLGHHHDHGHAATEHDDHDSHAHQAHDHGHEADDHEHDHGHEAEAHQHGHQAEGHEPGEITLEPEAAEQFGVVAQRIEPSTFSDAITVSGQIVDSPNSASIVTAPTAGVVKFARGMMAGSDVRQGATVATISAAGISGGDTNAAALAALEAAQAELDRLKPLYDDKLVTAKAYNDAVQAYKQAKAAYSSSAASGRAVAASSGIITQLMVQEGQYVDAGAPIATISSNRSLTLRADLPERYAAQLPAIQSANIMLPHTNQIVSIADLGGKRTSSGAAVSAQRGYLPVYFTLNNDQQLIPGSFVRVMLLGAPRHDVLAVPLSALSEQQGAYFVYEKLDDECYRKIPVTLGANDGLRAVVTSGLQPGQEIVTQGVIGVRLAETAAVAPEGHSHNH